MNDEIIVFYEGEPESINRLGCQFRGLMCHNIRSDRDYITGEITTRETWITGEFNEEIYPYLKEISIRVLDQLNEVYFSRI